MSTKPETNLGNRIHKYLPPEMSVEKMNNPFRAGPWDFYYDCWNRDGWSEHKYMARSFKEVRFDWAMDNLLSPRQKLWGLQRLHNGRRVCIITGFRDKSISIAHPYYRIERPFTAKEAAEWICKWLGVHDEQGKHKQTLGEVPRSW